MFFVAATGCVVVCVLVLAACKFPLGPSPSTKTGSLRISLTNSVNARTLLPSIGMTVATYTVTGTGPNNATFTLSSTGAPITQDGLAFGSWTIVVDATNSSGQLIGTGTASAQVNTGETTAVTVTVSPIAGTGSLSLGVSWPSSQVQKPSIKATLTPALGTDQDLTFTMTGASASYTDAAVGNGYYTLAFTLADNRIVVAGAVEVVRIVAGQTTSGSYTFSNVNAPGGAVQVNITPSMAEPLEVHISGGQETQGAGSTQTLTASVSNYSGNVVYLWYVNGASQTTTGPSFTFGSGVATGYYRIDVTAFSADGTQGGSATLNVQVTPGTGQGYLYVANAGGSSVSAFSIDPSGALSPISGTFTTGAGPNPVVISPNGKYLYAPNNVSTVSAFSIGLGGVLSPISGTFTTGIGPTGAAISPDGNYLYTANFGSSTVSAFSIDSGGALSSIGTFPAGVGANGVAISPNGNYLYVANQGGGSVSGFAIGPGGVLSSIGNFTNGIMAPARVAISPSGNYLYATNANSATVSAYRIGSDGTLSAIADFLLGSFGLGIAISPSGTYLYTANDNGTVGAFSVGSEGALSSVGDFAAEANPSGIAISPNGRYLYVANLRSDTISAFSIGPGGLLTSIPGPFATGPSPSGIAIVSP